ncbi:MAG TPA: beta galactosidase jelly roll domain-containing protein [Pseudomonadales bacterium]|nr:beta galactosidase jelly roll domain-containing protein [Pseudomonadales bacterium]
MFIRNRVVFFLAVTFFSGIYSFYLVGAGFTPPVSPRAVYNFNPGWKFFKGDVSNAEQAAFDDSKWADISTPHTWNDTDTYDEIISHSGGERHQYAGIGWYRKHFKLPAGAKDGKVFLEFEGLRQAAHFWVNGKEAGKYENGVTPVGLDLTPFVNFDGDNVIAVKVDNSDHYQEEAAGAEFEWEGRAFNPNYGGLNHDIRLILTGKTYQTLPLYENLKTTGIYVYPSNFSIQDKTCDVNIESQVKNESGDQESISLSAVVVDAHGNVCATFPGDTSDLVDGETEILKANGQLTNALFWSDEHPNLYDVYCVLTVDGKTVDVQKITTGFRKTAFKGGVGTGGVYLNDQFVWLTGYAQRSSDAWAGLGEAYPDWMHDYNANLIKSTHANYVRWMHISPQAADVRACDQAGIIDICPAGDKESDPGLDRRLSPQIAAAQWEQRMAVMRDSMIFFRNDPSILFWEAGNFVLLTNHMQEMVDLRKQWDPAGGRVIGTRDNDNAALNNAITPIAEYYGVMMSQDQRTDQIAKPGEIFRGYSVERRDRAPLIEAEDFRDEAARRFWDDCSPPHFGFKPGPDDTWHWNSETFCLAGAVRYYDYVANSITNTNPAHSKWSGYASIFWSDENADGRQDSSEVARVSGKVDAVRLPKQAYYVYRVMQSPTPDIHIIGHWTYPAGTTKTVYVAANHCSSVQLFINGQSFGITNKPCNFVDTYNGGNKSLGDTGYIYAFPNVKFVSGDIKAEGMADGKVVATDQIETAGEPKAIKLTVHTGPSGLQADGSDVAFIDFEVVDANGRCCPTDEARVDFQLTGPAIWRGGYNSGITNSINNLYLDTECGINRVAIRSTLQPGAITLTATRPGLEPATIQIQSQPVKIQDGLADNDAR